MKALVQNGTERFQKSRKVPALEQGGTVGYWGELGFTAGYPAVCLVIPVPQISLAGRNGTEWTAGYKRVDRWQGTGYCREQGPACYRVCRVHSNSGHRVKNTAEY